MKFCLTPRKEKFMIDMDLKVFKKEYMSMEALVLMTFFHTSLAVVSLVAWAGDLTEELVKEERIQFTHCSKFLF